MSWGRGRLASMNAGLKKQLIISFMIIISLVMGVISTLVYYGILDALEKQSAQLTLQQFQQAEFNINNVINDTNKLSQLLITDMDVQEFINNNPETKPEQIGLYNRIFSKLQQQIYIYDHIQSIVMYGENGLIVRKTLSANDFLEDVDKKSWFFQSKYYPKNVSIQPSLKWYGGLRISNFDILGQGWVGVDQNLMTAVRPMNCLGQSTRCGTLVINVYEDKMNKVYNTFSPTGERDIYMLDENGMVISSRDTDIIGEISPLYNPLDFTGNNGSFFVEGTEDKLKVDFLFLEQTGWYVVSEIPYDVFVESVRSLRKTLIIVAVAGVAVMLVLAYYWIYRITRPLNSLVIAMRELGKGNLGISVDAKQNNEFELLRVQFNSMSWNMNKLVAKMKEGEQEQRRLEIEALQAQLNPHFMYNTLNSIKWMAIMAGAPNVADSITTLGNLLYQIFNSRSAECTLQEELSYTRMYVAIMNFRHSEGIHLQLQIDSEVEQSKISRFIFQPLIENAIIHGMNGNNGRIDISIKALRFNHDVRFCVEDDGRGITMDRLKLIQEALNNEAPAPKGGSYSIGLVNVHKKLRLQYGEAYGLQIESEPGRGTRILFRIPFSGEQ